MNERFLSKAKVAITDFTFNAGEWVEGYYLTYPEDDGFVLHYIHTKDGDGAIIVPQTLCQCTGLKDKNGKLIFEGDKVVDGFGGVNRIAYAESEMAFIGIPIDDNEEDWIKGNICLSDCMEINLLLKKGEIIGNIHDKEGD